MFGFDEEILIGSGAFGNVYRVKRGDEYLALKEIRDPAARNREITFLKAADHPLFPKYVDASDEQGYILEEYIWGSPFDECIERRGGFAQPECMRFAIAVADGIAFLQQSDKSIIFRDLKAENLILQPDGEIRLCDLGAAVYPGQGPGGHPLPNSSKTACIRDCTRMSMPSESSCITCLQAGKRKAAMCLSGR